MKRIILLMMLLAILGCENAGKNGNDLKTAPIAPSETAAIATQENQLSMKIDGVEWRFENELMGGINPISDKPEMLISGSRGANDASEQTFTVIIRGANQPGSYRVKSGDASQSNFQISGLNESEFLAGNMMPFDLTVTLSDVAANPMRMRATFQGSIQTNTGRTLEISDGVFHYQD
jgi:hypothetical protein